MYISQQTYNALNELLALNFQMNSFCDNIAYNLGYNKMVRTEPIFHEKFAHAFPGFADIISEMMIELEARPIRNALRADIKEYGSNIEMFSDLKQQVDKYREAVLRTIEIADINNDVEIKIKLEDFSNSFTKYLAQVNVWELRARQYGNEVERFDNHFEGFTSL